LSLAARAAAICFFVIIGGAGLASMTSPASAMRIFEPERMRVLCLQEPPFLHCFELTVAGGDGQSCLSHGGWITVGIREKFTAICWNRKSQVVFNWHPTGADNHMAESCLKRGDSIGFEKSRIACIPTPSKIREIAGSLPFTSRLPRAETLPDDGGDRKCPPECSTRGEEGRGSSGRETRGREQGGSK
jgi:hypothetical protein